MPNVIPQSSPFPAGALEAVDGNDLLDPTAGDAVAAIAQCRAVVVARANAVLADADTSPAGSPDLVPRLSALLMASLEALKLAEFRLRDDQTRLRERSAAADARSRHYQVLFVQAPAAALITDIYATIQEANLAASRLFRRELQSFERTPLAELLPTSGRDEFRRQLARFSPSVGVRAWRLQITRVGDLPLEATATVRFVPDLGPTGSGLLYWMFVGST